MASKFLRLANGGYIFVFKYDTKDSTLLHIYARHLTNPDIAMKTWFEGDEEIWSEQYERYETSDANYTVYWYWIKENEVVMIISCFLR